MSRRVSSGDRRDAATWRALDASFSDDRRQRDGRHSTPGRQSGDVGRHTTHSTQPIFVRRPAVTPRRTDGRTVRNYIDAAGGRPCQLVGTPPPPPPHLRHRATRAYRSHTDIADDAPRIATRPPPPLKTMLFTCETT